ncbi:depupylase/deamidase Dop [Gephyromycinifex aptenodytis]|uniref:depupylase/deamidase Dop n=1 Tax=Gephyromycinifex aptenodytis TaxID=2716227 RepID=UPI001446CF6F|nr:depupylase/deamidase Dop [Gephyromycinifex aptenodytis]
MTVRRAMGIETEYGISVPGRPALNPILLSGRVVTSYADAGHGQAHRTKWDYAGESPLADARGFTMSRAVAHSSQLTDEWADDPAVANVCLPNGARLYVDHAHPEYSSPEVATPREALIWDRAGEVVMAEAARLAASDIEPPIDLYKNNTDGKGASYGTHENYLVSRHTPFEDIVAGITPFFVARQIMCGAGRVGIGQNSEEPGYQISSRADFFEAEVGLETTYRRPIVNTRDEPHAYRDKYRRLHVIIGDANLCDVANLLKIGTTSLVLGLIEAGRVPSELQLADPLRALRTISHDPDLGATVETRDGRRLTAVDLMWSYYELAAEHCSELAGGRLEDADADTREVLDIWETLLSDLGTDPATCADRVDWIAKRQLLEGYRARDGLTWQDSRLSLIDIQWSDLRAGKGLARRLEARGRMQRLVSDDEIEHAVTHPPESTRAYFRGQCVRRYPGNVVAASWETVLFDLPGQRALQRLSMGEPFRGSAALTRELFERHSEAADLLRELSDDI